MRGEAGATHAEAATLCEADSTEPSYRQILGRWPSCARLARTSWSCGTYTGSSRRERGSQSQRVRATHRHNRRNRRFARTLAAYRPLLSASALPRSPIPRGQVGLWQQGAPGNSSSTQRPPQPRVDPLRGLLLHGGQHMAVSVRGDADRGVPKALLHDPAVHALTQEHRRPGAPRVVRPTLKAGPLEDADRRARRALFPAARCL